MGGKVVAGWCEAESSAGEQLVEVAAGEAQPAASALEVLAASGIPLPGGGVDEVGGRGSELPAPAVVDRAAVRVEAQAELGQDLERGAAVGCLGETGELVFDGIAAQLR